MPAPPIIAVALNAAIDRTLEVPGLAIGGHLRGRLIAVQPAGKAVNVARLLASLGTPCTLTGFVGEGDAARFERSMAGLPVRAALQEVAGRTRENITLVDPLRSQETHIRDAGLPVTPPDLARLAEVLADVAGPGAIVIFSGSLPPGMDAAMFADLLGVCRTRGARVVVDTSGPGLDAVRRMVMGVGQGGPHLLWLIKPNREELAELAGRAVTSDADVLAAAMPLRSRIDQIAVTLGRDGAFLFSGEGAWRARLSGDSPPSGQVAGGEGADVGAIAPARSGRIVKTVGSGDAFLAGFIKARAEGGAPADCLRLAVACGTASTFQLSAGQVDPADVAACVARVDVTQVG